MKTIYITLVATLFSVVAISQSKIERRYKNYEFAYVINKLSKATLKNNNERLLLANSYYNINDLSNALNHYERIDNKNTETLFRYSHCLKASGDYKKGNKILRQYYKFDSTNEKYSQYFEDIITLNRLGNRYSVDKLSKINTNHSEYFNDVKYGELYYTSNAKRNTFYEEKYKWDNSNFLNIYKFNLKDSTNVKLNALNTNVHEGDICFNKSGNTVYFTSNEFIDKRENSKKIISLKIFRANLGNGKFTNVTPLSFNSIDYSCKNPFIKGDTLYFSSNRKGGYGKYDIYKTCINNFDKVINLGPKVNTEEDEDFPFFNEDNDFYFSSNGYVGYGQKDIYVRKYDSVYNEYSRPYNIGLPLNSKADDFGFYIKNKKGFYSSNIEGDDNIYSIIETKGLELDKIIQTLNLNLLDSETKNPISDVSVKVINLKTKDTLIYKTDKLGLVSAEVYGKTNYQLIINHPDYKNVNDSFQTNNIKYEKNNLEYLLDKKPCFKTFDGYVINEKTKESLPNAQIKIINSNKELVISSTSNSSGYYTFKLPCNNVYELEVNIPTDKEPFFVKYIETIDVGKYESVTESKNILLKELDKIDNDLVVKDDVLQIESEPIYFDYNKYKIKSKSHNALVKVSDKMKSNPSWILFVNSHTDNRGSENYNMKLSIKRALETKKYLIKLGVPSERIFHKGYG